MHRTLQFVKTAACIASTLRSCVRLGWQNGAMGELKSNQLNVRVDGVLEAAIDRKRIELCAGLGHIPSRSEIVRLALEAFLTPDAVQPSAPDTSRKATKRR
jgi:hypothetical protein